MSYFRCGSTGAVFSIDVALGIFVAVLLLGYAAYYTSHAEDPSSLKQMERVGYDVVSMLNYRGLYDSLDRNVLSLEVVNETPSGYGLVVGVVGNFPAANITTNATIDWNTTVVTGSIPVSMYNSSLNIHYIGYARFWIWPK